MLSLGWSEITIIIVLVIIVVGPKEIPNLLKQLGYVSKKIKSLSRDFNTSLNNIVKETEIDQVQKKIKKISKIDVKEEILNKAEIKDEFKDKNSSFNKINKDLDKLDKEKNE